MPKVAGVTRRVVAQVQIVIPSISPGVSGWSIEICALIGKFAPVPFTAMRTCDSHITGSFFILANKLPPEAPTSSTNTTTTSSARCSEQGGDLMVASQQQQ